MCVISGKSVVLLEGELRKPSVHRALGIPQSPGLTEFYRGEASAAGIQHRDDATGVIAIPSGRLGVEPTKVLASEKVRRLIEDLTLQFDLVLIDSPSLMAVSDARLLAPEVDATVFVVRWGKTYREVVRQGLKELLETGATVGGIVLSLVDADKHAQYYFGDSGYYHKGVRSYTHAAAPAASAKPLQGTMIARAAVVVMALVGTAVAWTLLRSGMDAPVEAGLDADASRPSPPTMAIARAPEPYSELALASAPAPTSSSAAATGKAETSGPMLAEPARKPTEAVVIPLPTELMAPDRLAEQAMEDEQPTPATPSPLASHAEMPGLRPPADPRSPAPVALLLARGDELLAISDVSSARLFFARGAAQGNTQAMTAMASTYDPLMLASRNVRNVHPEPRRAISWYRRAAAAGDATAEGRLRALIDVLRSLGQIDASSAALLRVGEEGS
jgi:hypothetical protein